MLLHVGCTMKTFLSAALAALVLVPAAGEAAVYRFDYETQFIERPEGLDPSIGGWEGVQTGWMIIDESLFPGGSLSNAVVEMDWDWELQTFSSIVATYKVHSPSGTIAGTTDMGSPAGWGFDWSGFGLMQTGGRLDELLGSSIKFGYFRMSFDGDGHIIRWGGANMQGGFHDPHSYGDLEAGIGSDGDWFHSSPGPGTWTRTALVADLPQVPLPAGAALLGGALVALSLIRGRRPHRTA
jgi:hypothetical protein